MATFGTKNVWLEKAHISKNEERILFPSNYLLLSYLQIPSKLFHLCLFSFIKSFLRIYLYFVGKYSTRFLHIKGLVFVCFKKILLDSKQIWCVKKITIFYTEIWMGKVDFWSYSRVKRIKKCIYINFSNQNFCIQYRT